MEQKVYHVSEITRQIKLLLEDSFPALWVEGEISNFRPHHSGHLYFTLKDSEAQISCVMWRSRAQGISVQIADGLKVRVYGSIRLYEKSGRYQLDLLRIESAGLGDLQYQFEQLKERLHGEGLFDVEHKRKLPQFPQKIGVITSLTGAAIQDIISVFLRRSPSTNLILYGVKVQGEGAAAEIVNAINLFNADYAVDIIIVGRGGGSLEDLWAFNEEIVARAIFNSQIPIISAVGHEIDYTIADFVSDVRAPTPSVAAEIACPNDEDLRIWLGDVVTKQKKILQEHINRLRSEILNIKHSYSFRRPKDILYRYVMQIEDITQHLIAGSASIIAKKKIYIKSLQNQLESLNPFNVLNRGYSMVFKNEKLIASVKNINIDDEIAVKLKDGQLTSTVSKKNYEQKKDI
jgi:exodeoxyribonuclease VII large subunit